MKLFIKYGILVAAVSCGSGNALADNTVLTKSATPILRSYPGHAVDILGIAPGMTVDTVKAILSKKYNFDPAETTNSLGITYKSVNMSSQPYTVELEAKAPNDDVMVYFGTPSTGNTVVGVDRELTFPDPQTAPQIASLQKETEAKYGTTSSSKQQMAANLYENWVFNNHVLQGCINSYCAPASPSFDPANMGQYYQNSVETGNELHIQVEIVTTSSDPSRASMMEIILDDLGNKNLTLQEALKQLNMAAAAAYNKEATPQQGPSL